MLRTKLIKVFRREGQGRRVPRKIKIADTDENFRVFLEVIEKNVGVDAELFVFARTSIGDSSNAGYNVSVCIYNTRKDIIGIRRRVELFKKPAIHFTVWISRRELKVRGTLRYKADGADSKKIAKKTFEEFRKLGYDVSNREIVPLAFHLP
jgi:hypothetical protein